MTGANKLLDDGQVLFKAGDPGDGMYLIRKGELEVFIEKDGTEVSLARIGAGGMIGEMALFDRQPRSASVKAVDKAEVTLISNADFAKLMKQIPKWFVGLMSALSTRLRQTNERLQAAENGGGPIGRAQFLQPAKYVSTTHFCILRDGEKAGKEWTINKDVVADTLREYYAEPITSIDKFFRILAEKKLVKSLPGKDKQLAVANKGLLGQFAKFVAQFAEENNDLISQEALDILKVAQDIAKTSPYDAVTISLPALLEEAKNQGLKPSHWQVAVSELKAAGEGLKLVNAGGGIGIKSSKKDLPRLVVFHDTLRALVKARL